jgi:hypothetical protein
MLGIARVAVMYRSCYDKNVSERERPRDFHDYGYDRDCRRRDGGDRGRRRDDYTNGDGDGTTAELTDAQATPTAPTGGTATATRKSLTSRGLDCDRNGERGPGIRLALCDTSASPRRSRPRFHSRSRSAWAPPAEDKAKLNFTRGTKPAGGRLGARSRMRTGQAHCLSTMCCPRHASLSSGGGSTCSSFQGRGTVRRVSYLNANRIRLTCVLCRAAPNAVRLIG